MSMWIDGEALASASRDIMDAVVAAKSWEGVLSSIVRATGSFGINVMDPRGGGAIDAILFTESVGECMAAYANEEWNVRDFRGQFIPMFVRNGVTPDWSYVTDEQQQRLHYYSFLAKHRMRQSAVISFSVGEDPLFFVLQRHKEREGFSPEEVAILHSLRRNLMVAGTMVNQLGQKKQSGILEAFEVAKIACVFFTPQGAVSFANERARAMMGQGMKITKGEFSFQNVADTLRFRRALHKVLYGDPADPETASQVLAVNRPSRQPLILRLQRVSGELRGGLEPARAFVLIESPDDEHVIDPITLRQAFGLTPAESEVALLLANGLNVEAIATERAISYETARTHLRAIYAKTGTSRQPELTALISRIRLG